MHFISNRWRYVLQSKRGAAALGEERQQLPSARAVPLYCCYELPGTDPSIFDLERKTSARTEVGHGRVDRV